MQDDHQEEFRNDFDQEAKNILGMIVMNMLKKEEAEENTGRSMKISPNKLESYFKNHYFH